jgi:hypothetical protein
MSTGEFGDRDEGDLNRLESRLGGWRPSLGGLDRDRLLYEAGRADVDARHRAHVRLSLAVSLAATLAAFASGLAWRAEHARGTRLEAELASTRVELDRLIAAAERTPTPPSLVSPGALPASTSERPDPFTYLSLTRRIADGRIDLDVRPGGSHAPEAVPTRPKPEAPRVGDREWMLEL